MLWRRKGETGRNSTADNSASERPGDRVPEIEARGAPEVRAEQATTRRGPPRSPRLALQAERVPAPVRRSASARHPMVVAGNAIFMALILLGIVAVGGVVIGKNRLEAAGPLSADKIVIIPRSGIRDVAEVLEREGVIDQPWLFVGAALLQKSRGELKSGEYLFPKQASLQEVIGTIIDGKVVQHAITIPEGLTSEQVVHRLLETDVLAGNIREIPREGSLQPETYRVTRGTSREQVIQRMQQAQRKVLQESWERRASDLPLRTPEELLTLASIVEKETGKAEERARVAAVFVNRLRQRMKLQSDPTIIYGLVGGKGTLSRPIMRSEITQPTPYNTYTIDGLPPGPIANPGRASLEAAANPARTRELYFVADGAGGHSFSETLAEHQKNVVKLRAIEQQQNDSSIAATAEDPPAEASGTAGPPQNRPRPAPPPRPTPTTRAPPPQTLAPVPPQAPAPPQAQTAPRVRAQ
jgi:UPF0755 protein